MVTVARPDFITVMPGPLSSLDEFNNKVPALTADQDRTVNKLVVRLRVAPVGASAIFEAFSGGTSIGTVTISSGSLEGSSIISSTIPADTEVTWTCNQTGLAPDVGETATCMIRVT